MSMLANVTKGKIYRPMNILLYGPGGIGKSTFAAKAPSPIFLTAEEGTDLLDVTRFPAPKTYEDVVACLNELATAQHDYKTIVVDSLDWIEPLIFDAVCRKSGVKSIELAAGGFGKGYGEAALEWAKFRQLLNVLREKRGMNIILLAHPKIEKFTNPQTQISYERYELKLDKRVKGTFMEWVDGMFFVAYASYTKRENDVVKSFSTDQRVMYSSWKDGYDAKNRYGIVDPIDLSLSWEDFVAACNMAPKLPPMIDLVSEIETMIPKIKDEVILAKIEDHMNKAKGSSDVKAMVALRNRIIELTKEH